MIVRLGLNAAAHVLAGVVTGALAVIAASTLMRGGMGSGGMGGGSMGGGGMGDGGLGGGSPGGMPQSPVPPAPSSSGTQFASDVLSPDYPPAA